jgi:hypothetical protein
MDIKQHITAHLTSRLRQRAHSMAVLKCMLQLNLGLKKTPPDQNILEKALGDLQGIIYAQCGDKYSADAINAIIPPSNLNFQDLIAKTLFILQEPRLKRFGTLLSDALNNAVNPIEWGSAQVQYQKKQSEKFREPIEKPETPSLTIHLDSKSTGEADRLKIEQAVAAATFAAEQATRAAKEALASEARALAAVLTVETRIKEEADRAAVQNKKKTPPPPPLPPQGELKARIEARIQAALAKALDAENKAAGFAKVAALAAEQARQAANKIRPEGEKPIPPPPPKK